jgi:hypothetical protein
LHFHRSATGQREHGQREHDKRAFHLFPPNDPVWPQAHEKRTRRAAGSIRLISAAQSAEST